MPWPIRTKLLGAYHATPAANTPITLGTVPVGKVWLIKDWSAYNGGAGTRATYLQITISGTTYVVAASPTHASGTTTGEATRHIAVPAGGIVKFQTSLATSIDFFVSGAELG